MVRGRVSAERFHSTGGEFGGHEGLAVGMRHAAQILVARGQCRSRGLDQGIGKCLGCEDTVRKMLCLDVPTLAAGREVRG